MKSFSRFALLGFLAMFTAGQLLAAAANGNGKGNGKGSGNDKDKDDGKGDSVESVLSSVPAPELPAKAADIVDDAKPKDRESVALEVIRYIADERQVSIVPVVSSVTAVLPGSAAAIAVTAGKLVPGEILGIGQAALGSAPAYQAEINRAIESLSPGNGKHEVEPPGKGRDNGGRPATPPGQEGRTIRGNRPNIPPGHEFPPGKPGRDPQRRHYGKP
jgi:hypothetical protein